MRRILLFLLSLVILLLLIIIFNTLQFKSKQTAVLSERKEIETDTAAINHLSSAIRIATISFDDRQDTSAFTVFNNFLRLTYPLTFEKLKDTVINRHSLILHWKTGSTLKPIILYAHLDVVPADTNNWKKNPFSGEIVNDSIYGRGAIDDKGSVIAIMEAVEKLVKEGSTPKRDLYIAFGHDEEADGDDGAKQIAAYLESQNVRAEFLLDEGGLIAVDMVPFVTPPVAMIFTSEKGYMTLELTVKGEGGHSGRPPSEGPVEIIAAAIRKIKEQPFETKYTQSVEDFMDYTGPEMKLPFRALFANRWLFGGIITGEYEKIPSAAAMLRTTSVATVIAAGEKENVVPSIAHAKINFRLLPGDNSKDVMEQIKKIINDERVVVTMLPNVTEASKVSPTDSPSFIQLTSVINKVFPDAIVAPSLLIAQTDSRHFRNVTENIYRFLPVRMNDATLDGMHGANERVGVIDFMESIVFYHTLISL